MSETPNPDEFPALGIDLDGTIDQAAAFFCPLSHIWPGKVFVITYRTNQEKAEADVAKWNVRVDEVVLVNKFEQKAVEIAARNIKVYFDDMDEMLLHVPADVTVFKIRNEGNYDYDIGKWLYSKHTGREL